MRIKMKQTIKVSANSAGTETILYKKDGKYDSDDLPWKTQLHVDLVNADLAVEVKPSNRQSIAEKIDEMERESESKAIDESPENKAIENSPENKEENDETQNDEKDDD